jgi:hypothetical protein
MSLAGRSGGGRASQTKLVVGYLDKGQIGNRRGVERRVRMSADGE